MRRKAGIVLLILAVFMFLCGIYLVWQKFEGYRENEEIYDKVESSAVVQNKPDDSTETEDGEEQSNENGKTLPGMDENEYYSQYDGPTIQWDELSDDTVAWIMFGEQISYPVMQGSNNKYYLTHAYDGTKNANGSIFMNSHNDAAFRDVNTIIYGHNLRSGKMFGTFKHYLGEKKDDMRFYIFTPDGCRRTYEIISVGETKDGGFAYQYSFKNMEGYQKFLKDADENSAYSTGYSGDVEKRCVTLSTCRSVGSAQGWRVVIIGKEVEARKVQNPAKWYKEPENDVITILDVKKGMEKTTEEINRIKRERKEEEARRQSKKQS